MSVRRILATMVVALIPLGCGSDGDSGSDTTTTTTTGDSAAPTSVPVTSVSATSTSSMSAPSTTTGPTTSPSEVTQLEQPAIWPAADIVFETPEQAAADFVTTVLGVPPTLGEFVGGDSRSGEIEVFSPGESGVPVSRGLLLLRMLGPDDGWFVLAAIGSGASISSPESGADVAAGPLIVEGVAQGHERNVVVTAFSAGDFGALLDQQITMGGLESPEPFTVNLDLSAAAPGEVVTLLVSGGAGLETDPGNFTAIPVVIVA